MNKTTEALKLAEEALNAMLTHMGMDEDEWTKPTFNQAREALAAIREALAEPEITTPDVCGEVCARAKLCYGCGKAFDEALADHIADAGKVIAEPVKQVPVMDNERIFALREAERNGSEHNYFNTRPHNDTPTLRGVFCQGFDRGFNKGLKYAAPAQPVKQEPVAWSISNPKTVQDFSFYQTQTYTKPLYAAPVRTKDLTREEINDVMDPNMNLFEFASAVIAADREKNK